MIHTLKSNKYIGPHLTNTSEAPDSVEMAFLV